MTMATPPAPSKVTADMTTKEDPVAVIERDGLRLGTAADAGRVCVNPKTGRGVSGPTYRFYVRTQAAPTPYLVRHQITGRKVPARDEQGRELFDLDAVAAWNAERPGPGARTGRPVKWTAQREQMLTAARDRQLWLSDKTGRPVHESLELTARHTQRISELLDAELLRRPRGRGGRYTLTRAGQEWLTATADDPARLRHLAELEHAPDPDPVACATG